MSRAGETEKWLRSLPAWAASCEGVKAVFTMSESTAARVRSMNLPGVVVNPKPKEKIITFYDEAASFARAAGEAQKGGAA